MPVKFCPKCEKLLKQRKEGEKFILSCDFCGYQIDSPTGLVQPRKISKAALEKKIAVTKTLVVDKASALNMVPIDSNIICYRCKSHKIEYAELQTRRADEPMTRFFRCANCGNRWRG